MAKGYKVCKVCGKQYEYCTTERRADLFRWQDAACCPEHGAAYFEKVLASREKRDDQTAAPASAEADEKPTPKKRARKKKTEPETTVGEKEMA